MADKVHKGAGGSIRIPLCSLSFRLHAPPPCWGNKHQNAEGRQKNSSHIIASDLNCSVGSGTAMLENIWRNSGKLPGLSEGSWSGSLQASLSVAHEWFAFMWPHLRSKQMRSSSQNIKATLMTACFFSSFFRISGRARRRTEHDLPQSGDWLEWLHLLRGSSYSGQLETSDTEQTDRNGSAVNWSEVMDLLVSVSTSSATSFDSAAMKRWRGDNAVSSNLKIWVGKQQRSVYEEEQSLHDLPLPSFLWWHGGHHMLTWCTSPGGRTKEWSRTKNKLGPLTHADRWVLSLLSWRLTTSKRHSTSLISESDSLVMLWFALTSWNVGLVGPPTSPSPASRPTQQRECGHLDPGPDPPKTGPNLNNLYVRRNTAEMMINQPAET